jgi:hypothetical protein
MLLDRFVPVADFSEVHSAWVPASPERALDAVKAVEPGELPVTRLFFAARFLPARLLRRRREPLLRAGTPLYELMRAEGFVLLGEEPGREVVFGVVGRFWTLRGGSSGVVDTSEGFLAFDAPGYAKAAMNFLAEPEGAGSRIRTETRVATTDAPTRRIFSRYWLFVRPGSGLIRREWLRAAKRRLEHE